MWTITSIVTLSGYEGDTLSLAANQIPAVGNKLNDTYKVGACDVTPSAGTIITAATTYTYTYAAKGAVVITQTPTANTLTYDGQAHELITAGKATGGTMQYALGTDAITEPDATAYSTSIPTGKDDETYYVWYKVIGDSDRY